jgi:hypothetical protein
MPVICHLYFGWKKFLYVFLSWPFGVAVEDPRKTIVLIINLPLYSPTAPSAILNFGYGR